MKNELTITVIGGDRRQIESIHLLLNMGHKVNAFGFDNLLDSRVNLASEIEERMFNCQVLLLPIPYKDEEGNINMKESNRKVPLKAIMEYAEKYKPLVVLGKPDKVFMDLAMEKEIDYLDLTNDEAFAVLNSIPTAEGAIWRAMDMTEYAIHGSKALVLGYGRIGKSLSRMLKGIGARVTVAARRRDDLAWIVENGYTAVHLKDLDDILPSQNIIFNTIPHLILNREKLLKVDKGAVIIDLSSYPGGVDFVAARELKLEASLDLGLPGKVAPKTAAEIIVKVMMDSLQERMT
ncbi:MAG: dipicolinate synthase subunit DpsA [Caldicoprobacterales bacterium]|jgi:dipicolinate synthase subunit A